MGQPVLLARGFQMLPWGVTAFMSHPVLLRCPPVALHISTSALFEYLLTSSNWSPPYPLDGAAALALIYAGQLAWESCLLTEKPLR